MRPSTLVVHIYFLLSLPLALLGQWYDDVLESGPTCEDIYPVDSCLNDNECLMGFLECECIPREMRVVLQGTPEDGHSLCLYADIILGLGAPSCCLAHKRALLGSMDQLPHNSQVPTGYQDYGGGPSSSTQAASAVTAAKKRTPTVPEVNHRTMAHTIPAVNHRALAHTIKLLLTGAPKTYESKAVNPRRANFRTDDILIRTLYDYLRYLISKNDDSN